MHLNNPETTSKKDVKLFELSAAPLLLQTPDTRVALEGRE